VPYFSITPRGEERLRRLEESGLPEILYGDAFIDYIYLNHLRDRSPHGFGLNDVAEEVLQRQLIHQLSPNEICLYRLAGKIQ